MSHRMIITAIPALELPLDHPKARIFELYWEGALDEHGAFIFANKVADIARLTKVRGHEVSQLQAHGGTIEIADVCVECGVPTRWGLAPRSQSRDGLLSAIRHIAKFGRCKECEDIAAHAEAQRRERAEQAEAQSQEQERAFRQQQRDRERGRLRKQWGAQLIGDCPNCDGFRVLRFNSKELTPFIGCTSFQVDRRRGFAVMGCGYTQRLPVDEEARWSVFLAERMAAIVRRIQEEVALLDVISPDEEVRTEPAHESR